MSLSSLSPSPEFSIQLCDGEYAFTHTSTQAASRPGCASEPFLRPGHSRIG